MSRRFVILALAVVTSQLSSGCHWIHNCVASHCGACGHKYCSPPVAYPPVSSGPVYSAPCYSISAPAPAAGPNCPSCYLPPVEPRTIAYGPSMQIPPPGAPVISNPIPLGTGPKIETVPQGLPMPNPLPSTKN